MSMTAKKRSSDQNTLPTIVDEASVERFVVDVRKELPREKSEEWLRARMEQVQWTTEGLLILQRWIEKKTDVPEVFRRASVHKYIEEKLTELRTKMSQIVEQPPAKQSVSASVEHTAHEEVRKKTTEQNEPEGWLDWGAQKTEGIGNSIVYIFSKEQAAKMSPTTKKIIGAAVTIGALYVAARILFSFFKGKEQAEHSNGGFWKKALIIGGVGLAAFFGGKYLLDRYMKGQLGKVQKEYEKKLEQLKTAEGAAAERLQSEAENLRAKLEEMGGEVERPGVEIKDTLEKEAIALKYRVSVPFLLRVFGDDAENIDMKIFDDDQQRIVRHTLLRISSHPKHGIKPPLTVGDILSMGHQDLFDKLYESESKMDDIGIMRLKACKLLLTILRAKETALREHHSILSRTVDSDLPKAFEDLTFDQAFNLTAYKTFNDMGALAEHSVSIAQSIIPIIGGNAAGAVNAMLNATKDTVQGISMHEFGYLLQLVPAEDQKEIRLKNITRFVADHRDQFLSDVEKAVTSSHLNPQEKRFMTAVINEVRKYATIEDGSLLDEACLSDNSVKESLRGRWNKIPFLVQLELVYLHQRGDVIPLSLKVLRILRADSAAFGKHAGNLAFETSVAIIRTATGWLVGLVELPEEWQRYYRMVRREVGENVRRTASTTANFATSKSGRMVGSFVLGSAISYSVFRRIAIRQWGAATVNYYFPSIPRAIRRMPMVPGSFTAKLNDHSRMRKAREARAAGTAVDSPTEAIDAAKAGKAARPRPASAKPAPVRTASAASGAAEKVTRRAAGEAVEQLSGMKLKPGTRAALDLLDVGDNVADMCKKSPKFAAALAKHLDAANNPAAVIKNMNRAFGNVDDPAALARLAKSLNSEKKVAKLISITEMGGDFSKTFSKFAKLCKVLDVVSIAGDVFAIYVTVHEMLETAALLEREMDNEELRSLYMQRYAYHAAELGVAGTGIVAGGMALAGVGGAVATPVAVATLPISMILYGAYEGHKWSEAKARTAKDWAAENSVIDLLVNARTYSFGEKAGHGWDIAMGDWEWVWQLNPTIGPFRNMYRVASGDLQQDAQRLVEDVKKVNAEMITAVVEHTTTVMIPKTMRDVDGRERPINREEFEQYATSLDTYVKAKTEYILSQIQDVFYAVGSGADVEKLMENAENYALYMKNEGTILAEHTHAQESGDEEHVKLLDHVLERDLDMTERAERYRVYKERKHIEGWYSLYLTIALMNEEEDAESLEERFRNEVSIYLQQTAQPIIIDFGVRCREENFVDGSQPQELNYYLMDGYKALVQNHSTAIAHQTIKNVLALRNGQDVDSKFTNPVDALEDGVRKATAAIRDHFLRRSPRSMYAELSGKTWHIARTRESLKIIAEMHALEKQLAALRKEVRPDTHVDYRKDKEAQDALRKKIEEGEYMMRVKRDQLETMRPWKQ